MIFFASILMHICKARKVSAMATADHQSARDFLPYVKLPVLLGLSWVMGFIGSQWNNEVMWVIFDVTNASQGILLFLVFISSKRNRGLYGLIRRKTKNNTNVSKLSSKVNK